MAHEGQGDYSGMIFVARRSCEALNARELPVQIGQELVEAIDFEILKILAKALGQRLDMRVRLLGAPFAPIDAVPEFHASGGPQQGLHNRGLGSSVADHDKRCGIQQGRQCLHQCWIERLCFADQIAVRVLLGFSVEPGDLRARTG
jgi:hypothetical protein